MEKPLSIKQNGFNGVPKGILTIKARRIGEWITQHRLILRAFPLVGKRFF
jgi:hypothetical protein